MSEKKNAQKTGNKERVENAVFGRTAVVQGNIGAVKNKNGAKEGDKKERREIGESNSPPFFVDIHITR